MSIYTTTNSGLTHDWVDALRYAVVTHHADSLDDVVEYEPISIASQWVPDNQNYLVTTNTLKFDVTTSADTIKKYINGFYELNSDTIDDYEYTTWGKPVKLGDDNQFCLNQDDSEVEEESDETLPEFLDTFEVKEGERMDV